jgi:hypothetical protein
MVLGALLLAAASVVLDPARRAALADLTAQSQAKN